MKTALNVSVAVLSFLAAAFWFWSARVKVYAPGEPAQFSFVLMKDGTTRTRNADGGGVVEVEATAALAAMWNRRAAIAAGLAAFLQAVLSLFYP